jgi:hypothetical protein
MERPIKLSIKIDNMIRELRIYLAELLIGLALRSFPDCPERIHFSRLVNHYFHTIQLQKKFKEQEKL